MKKAKYICIEGTEGVGKTTQSKLLVEYLQSIGKSVLKNQEPGSPHAPITLELRKLMLDNSYDQDLSQTSRELISLASRSINLEKIIAPNLNKVDYIIQDRGFLSGLSYGSACGNDPKFLKMMINQVIKNSGLATSYSDLYDHVIILKGNPSKNLNRAKNSKQEFKNGDAMESRGNQFMANVERYMTQFAQEFQKTTIIDVDNKSIEEVFDEIKMALNL